MSEMDNVVFGSDEDPMPRIGSIEVAGSSSVKVTWCEGSRAGRSDKIDLSPLINAYKIYEPLRKNKTLFSTIHVAEDGNAIAWGKDNAIDMAATTIEQLTQEMMTSEELANFLSRNSLTQQAAASALGRSRRQIANYLSTGNIPRIVALACFGYESRKRNEHTN